MNKKVKKNSVKVENKPLAEANAARAFGGSWGTHQDKRDRRSRTRQAAERNAIKDHS